MKIYIAIILFFIFTSCEKGETPIMPHGSGSMLTSVIELGPDYRYQIFYSLKQGEIISQNIKTDWDLAISSNIQNLDIRINTSRAAAAWKTNSYNFDQSYDLNSATWLCDSPDGNNDSSALFGIINNEIYIIDKGYSFSGNHTGYVKFAVESRTSNSCFIRYGSLDNSFDTVVEIIKNQNFNYVSYSFSQNIVVDVEPEKNNWDLVFTQYTHIFYNPRTPYLVTGVLINEANVLVALDTLNPFENISNENLTQYSFHNNRDVIGYNWKSYDMNAGEYSINTNLNYILNDKDGRYFKLHFIDYYNSSGDKGYPKFEIQEL